MGDDNDKESRETNLAPIAPATFVTWAQHAIFALFGLGFIAWAALVWSAREDVKAMYIEHTALTARVNHLEQELDQHKAEFGHPKSLEMHAAEQRQLTDMQEQINRRFADTQRELEALRSREYRAHDENGRPIR